MNLRTLLACFALAVATPLALVHVTGCAGTTTLEAGGAYSDPVLAQADRAILDASRAMTEFIAWQRANAAFLAKWPEIERAARNIESQRDGWEKDAYAARDAYASAAKDYRKAIADGVVGALPPSRAKIDGSIAVLTSVVTQIGAYRNAHRI